MTKQNDSHAQDEKLSRDALIDIIMRETTDEITSDGIPILRPNVLVQGCAFIQGKNLDGYENPEDAARKFAGFVADAILAALTPAEGGQASYIAELEAQLDAFGKISPQQYQKEIAQLRAQVETARAQAIEECAAHLERCGWRYSQGFDLPASLRRLKVSSTVRTPE